MDRNNIFRAVDIVVPVYNGYEDLIRCIESLRIHTDLSKHRVLLIDDCSPDERVRNVLREVSAGRKESSGHGMIAVFNRENRGFPANVNRGLSWSERDTILLNSDTVVTQGWVDKLQSCAYRQERIATVTPLSNAATLASVPYFLRDNTLPEGYTPDSYGRLVERVSLHRYPEISVGVGFCMYVKQAAFALAGPFDEKAFGRGYGEENDFCFRCSMLGFIHVLCDDTFIYHRGTASFASEQKMRLIAEHERILRKRYPQFMKKNDDYCAENPDSEIRDNLLLHQCLANGKRNLLYFLHLDFRQIGRKNIGGTQLHVRDLVAGAEENYNVFVCARDGDTLRLTVYLKGDSLPAWNLLQREESADAEGKLVTLKFPVGEEEPFPVLYDERIAQVLRKILASFSIDLVHVHHTQGISLDLFRECAAMNIPVIATLHDYYYACPTTKLLRPDGQFCPQTEVFAAPSDRTCAQCLRKNCAFGRVRVIRRWREENLRALETCSRIIFPSASARAVMCGVYPSLLSRSIIIGHGTDPVPSGTVPIASLGRIERTDRMHTRLDQMPGDGESFHYISGWAYLDGVKSADASILVEVTDSAGKTVWLQVRRQARPDVAAAAASQDYLWSGIHAVFQVPGLREGRIRIRILIREQDKTWTDGKVYRASWNQSAAGGGKLNVAYLGGVTQAKGSGLLKQLIESGDDSFRLFVFGEVGDRRVRIPASCRHIFFSGVYQKDDIFDLLRASRIDVALIPPVWAETFCYTLSEAWACQIPVIGTDIGAVGERIRETGAGWLVPRDVTGDGIRKLLARIASDPHDLKEKKKKTLCAGTGSVAAMNEKYRGLYDSFLVPAEPVVVKHAVRKDPEFLLQGLAMANPEVKGRFAAGEINRLSQENEMLRASMEMLKNTTSYRVARKISEANIPFKEPLKKILKKGKR